MRRALIALAGALLGAVSGVALGACSYFECQTIDQPLLSGTYGINGRPDYSFVFQLDGTATEDYVDGDTVHAEYTVGTTVATP
jgi:hypothetical protein